MSNDRIRLPSTFEHTLRNATRDSRGPMAEVLARSDAANYAACRMGARSGHGSRGARCARCATLDFGPVAVLALSRAGPAPVRGRGPRRAGRETRVAIAHPFARDDACGATDPLFDLERVSLLVFK